MKEGDPVDAPRYEIRTVEDFCAVPIDRLEQCLEEFKVCVTLALTARLVVPKTTLDRFTWIDDGEHNIATAITVQSRQPSGSVGDTASPTQEAP